MPTLYDETIAPGGSDRADYNGAIAFRFALSASQYLRSISYYSDSGSGDPTGVELFRTSDSARLWHNEAPVWTGARPGWRVWTLTATQAAAVPVLASGVGYSLQVNFAATGKHFRDGCDVPAQPDPWSYEGSFYGSYGTLNATSGGSGRWGLSAGVESSLPGGGGTLPATGGVVSENLGAWLSTDEGVQDHEEDGIPWLLKTELAATKLLVQGVLDNFRDADGNLRSIGDFAKEMTPTLVGVIKLFFNRGGTQLTGPTAAGGTAFAALQDRMTDLENQLDGLADLVTAIPAPFPGAGWTMADEVEFVQAKSWDVPADLYTLSTSDWPVSRPLNPVDGAPWRPRLGWWAPRNGDLLGARRFVDWEASILEDGGRRMQGVVVWLEPSTAGTLQAWRLT